MNANKRMILNLLVAIAVVVGLAPHVQPSPVEAASPNIVISQVYGGGGNSGTTYRNDFIELFNLGPTPVDISGWSVQYASSTGTTWQVTALSGVVQPGHYYLVQEAAGSGGTANLPTPDATGSIPMSATSGKVALANNSTALSGACPSGSNVVDFVGFGGANCSESSPTPVLSNTTAAVRNGSGCTDTDNNLADFATGAPNPRNSASPAQSCGAPPPTNPSGTGAANPSSVMAGGTTLLTVIVTPGANPTSTGLTVTGDLSSLGGAAAQPFFDDGTNGDAAAGDNAFSYQAAVADTTTPGAKNLPIAITDAESRTGNATIVLTVQAPAQTNPSGAGSANPSLVTVGNLTLLAVVVTPGANPTSTGLAVTGDLTPIGGSATQSFFDDGTNGDATAGDNVFSYQATVASGTTAGAKNLPIILTDAQGRSGSATIALTILGTSGGDVVISQIDGGGGNSGAFYKNDFIELYNRTASPIDLTGWTVQYASATGSSWTTTTLSGSIASGRYYLVQEAAGTSGTVNLPTPDATGNIAMSASNGKVALVTNSAALSGACPTSSTIMDLVGFGTANCFEGSGAASAPSNTSAAMRRGYGATDTNNNAGDFTTGVPAPHNTSWASAAPTVAGTIPASGATGVALNTNLVVTFTEPVNAAGNWLALACVTSGAHTASFSGGPQSFTLTPTTSLATSEACTVTVLASQVNALDSYDPLDTMAADYTWSFTTVAPTFIHDIQGAGHISPRNGASVANVPGIVTALRTTGSTRGFYLQDQAANYDADPATSEGIFVFTGSTSNPASLVSVGDLVQVSGKVSEYRAAAAGLTLTELTSPLTINRIS